MQDFKPIISLKVFTGSRFNSAADYSVSNRNYFTNAVKMLIGGRGVLVEKLEAENLNDFEEVEEVCSPHAWG